MIRLRTGTLAAVLCNAASACASPQQTKGTWVPTLAEVEDLEAHLSKPDPVRLAKSTRYYYGYYENESRIIRGEILADGVGADTKIHIVTSFPMIADGGCGIIHLSYDPAKQSVLSLRCNGLT